jgi:hypothetical protein
MPFELCEEFDKLNLKSTLSRFWKHQRGLLETRRSRCAKCNGVTTLRKKLLPKEKKNGRQRFKVSFLIHTNIWDEIHFMGGWFVTP